jgi:hypothetical protein
VSLAVGGGVPGTCALARTPRASRHPCPPTGHWRSTWSTTWPRLACSSCTSAAFPSRFPFERSYAPPTLLTTPPTIRRKKARDTRQRRSSLDPGGPLELEELLAPCGMSKGSALINSNSRLCAQDLQPPMGPVSSWDGLEAVKGLQVGHTSQGHLVRGGGGRARPAPAPAPLPPPHTSGWRLAGEAARVFGP